MNFDTVAAVDPELDDIRVLRCDLSHDRSGLVGAGCLADRFGAKSAPPFDPPGVGRCKAARCRHEKGELGVGQRAGPLLVADREFDIVSVGTQRLEDADAMVAQAAEVVEDVLAEKLAELVTPSFRYPM